jgi:hypothetical protein
VKNPFLRRLRPTFDEELHKAKQDAAHLSGARYYGDGGTIHGTNHLDVCLNGEGQVVEVWFRCQLLPFRVSTHTHADGFELGQPPISITGVEVIDLPQ